MMILSNFLKKYKSSSVLVRASFWFVICSFLQKGIASVTTPVFTRLMTAQEYGQYSVFVSWENILIEVVTLQLYSGVFLQGLVKFDNERKVFVSALQGLTFSLVVMWTCIYLLFHSFFNELLGLTTVQVLAMLATIWSSSVFSFWAGEQRVLYRYKKLVLLTLVVALVRPALEMTFIISSNDKVTARILAVVFINVIFYSGLFFHHLRQGKKFFSSKFWKYALAFNIPLVPHYLSQHVLHSADRIMIGYYIGAAEAGIYSLAYSISQIMTLFNTALSHSITPYIYQKIKTQKIDDIAKVAYTALPSIAGVNLFLILLAPEIVAIFAPPSYYDAIWIIPPVAMSVYFMFAYDFFAKFSLYHEKTKFVMLASMSGALLNLILNFIFIPKLGYMAAGWTTLVCYIVYTGSHYWGMKRVCDVYFGGHIPYNMKKILLMTVVFMLSSCLLLCTYNYPFVRYGILVLFLLFCILKRKWLLNVFKNFVDLKKTK